MSTIPNTFPKFLWHFAKRYKFHLFGFFLVSIFWASYLSLSPYTLKVIIDRVSTAGVGGSLYQAVFYPALIYVLLGVMLGFTFRIYDWLTLKTFPSMKVEIVEEMFDYVEKHSYRYFQQNFSGSLGNKINDMARSGTTVISNIIDYFLARCFSITFGAITMYLVNPNFALVLIVWSATFITISILLSKKAQKLSEIASEAHSTVVGKIVDSFTNILNVKIFARERYENKTLKVALEDAADKDRKTQWYLFKVKILYAVTITALSTIMMGLLIYERSHERVTIGDFALILTLNMFLIEEVYFLANQLVPFSEQVGTCKQALSVISQMNEIPDLPGAKELLVNQGKIVFKGVNYRYLDGEDVFHDLSIAIPAGQRVGLVGFSGSGKSTFVNLILRFFDVDSGNIFIDGQDIKYVTQESLRRQIAMIPQDPLLFHRSLLDNIGYGRLDASVNEILTAAKQAHCQEFIEKLQNGFDSLVGERGIKLSGGERQRIAIARAILKNAPILILDEATSSLDSVTENYINDSLSRLMEKRTTIVIAHRLSTLSKMDRILVFSHGKIIEDGTHDELLKLKGHYANLWNIQVGGFIPDSGENRWKLSN